MDLKTRPCMSPAYGPWHSWISGAQQYAPNCDRESGLRFSTLLEGFSMEIGTNLLCNCEEFLEKICGGLAETTAGKLIVMFSKVSKLIDLDAAMSFENGEGCLQAATVQSSIFARTYRLMAHTGKHSNLGNGWLWMKCFSTASVTILGGEEGTVYVVISFERIGCEYYSSNLFHYHVSEEIELDAANSCILRRIQGCSGTYTWLSRLHNRELEDKAKEVPELKTERHKKKLNIDKLEGIARLKLAEAAILKLTKHNGSLRGCKETIKTEKFGEECASNLEQRLAKAEAEKQYMFEKIKLTENSSSHHKVVVVEDTRHMCDVLKDPRSTSW
ncbi:LOW QUALITY PROTEIN: hypothetical protein HID58_013017 [Brassica napus]|uniref:Oberon coiled-coil region domain-containing protein n=1 Tax=Brassica napus TaxID=3708 RepID=A0ABQ8E2Q1_BRANA|nr:LOW QUALITY PROTEIN: hypothetical protein HID58_013017 [Brassica napus]